MAFESGNQTQADRICGVIKWLLVTLLVYGYLLNIVHLHWRWHWHSLTQPHMHLVWNSKRERKREEGRENVIQRTVLHTTSDFTNTISSKRCKWKFSALAFGIVLYWLATRTRMFHIICNYKKLYSAILLYRTGAATMRWRHFITSEQPMNMDGYLFSIFFFLVNFK